MAYRTCAACGADLKGKRYGARTCSAKCRKRLSRGEPSTLTIPGLDPEDPRSISNAMDAAISRIKRRQQKGR